MLDKVDSSSMVVFFIDDEMMIRIAMEQTLSLLGIDIQTFECAEAIKDKITADFNGIIITDVRLPKMSGLDLLNHCMNIDPTLPVVLVTGHGDVTMAVEAMRQGAYDFIEKPFTAERMNDVIRRAFEKRKLVLENRALRQALANQREIEATILGKSAVIAHIRFLIRQLANTSADILIMGETGTGKELVARCLHHFSQRGEKNFVALNCGAMPETVFESEVFGHEAGAFTGAVKRRIGKMEHAAGGTVFLDEIESMPLNLQVKLLRVLQEKKIERLGSNQLIPVDFRIIAATKADLKALSQQQAFRSDLYYRLNVVTIHLPPLRERREDIPILFEHFVLDAARRYQCEAPIVSQAQMNQLMSNNWEGNVRELRNVADRFVLGIIRDNFGLIQDHEIAQRPLAQQVEHFERCLIEDALHRCHYQVSKASEILGIPKKTLYDKINKYQIVDKK